MGAVCLCAWKEDFDLCSVYGGDDHRHYKLSTYLSASAEYIIDKHWPRGKSINTNIILPLPIFLFTPQRLS